MSVAFVFPGQGSQSVGMGKALADAYLPARQVFAEIDAALGDDLTTVMWEGPADRLMLTENAQPALVAVSLAAMRVLESEAGVDLAREAQFVAGHSVGEYSALAAVGSISIADAARLVRARGRAIPGEVLDCIAIQRLGVQIGVTLLRAVREAEVQSRGLVLETAARRVQCHLRQALLLAEGDVARIVLIRRPVDHGPLR